MKDNTGLPDDFMIVARELYDLLHDSVEFEKTQNIQILSQLKKAIWSLTEDAYTTHLKRSVIYDGKEHYSPIGSHVRHTLDFYLNFLNGVEKKPNGLFEVDYDYRDDQDPISVLVATRPEVAIATIDNIQNRLGAISGERYGMSNNEGPDKKGTTLGRELQVIISHTTHHMAIIGMTADQLGLGFGADFGVAHSTKKREMLSLKIS